MKPYHLVRLSVALTLAVGTAAKADWSIPVNLGPPVNTPLIEDIPVVDPGDSILVFYYNSSYSMKISRKVGGTWQTPEPLPPPIYDTGVPCYLSNISNGIRLYFSSMNRPGGLGGADIWYSDLVNGQWSTPQNMGAPINSFSNDVGFRLINSGMRAYFTSQRPGTRGDHDIWVSDWVSGQWTTPVNLGDSINSGYSDQEPTVTDDDQEMYFFRVGPGMQEPQIFTARKINGVWQMAVRAGWPIHWKRYQEENGPYLLPPGNRLYYCGPQDSTRVGGGDIWYVDQLLGVVEDRQTAGAPGAHGVALSVVNPSSQKLIAVYSLPEDGEVRIDLFDDMGRRVATLVHGAREAGRHEFRSGLDLAPGVYFLRLVTKEASLTRSVSILR